MDLCVYMGGTFSAQSMSALIIGSIGRVQQAWITELYGRSRIKCIEYVQSRAHKLLF